MFVFNSEIPGVANQCNQGPNAVVVSRICGTVFGAQSMTVVNFNHRSICGKRPIIRRNNRDIERNFLLDCTAPFTIDVVTDATNTDGGDAVDVPAAVGDRGVCLDYTQVKSYTN